MGPGFRLIGHVRTLRLAGLAAERHDGSQDALQWQGEHDQDQYEVACVGRHFIMCLSFPGRAREGVPIPSFARGI